LKYKNISLDQTFSVLIIWNSTFIISGDTSPWLGWCQRTSWL